MSTTPPAPERCRNRLLGTLSDEDYLALAPLLRPERLRSRQVVCQRGKAAAHVYFPTGCVLSVLTFMRNGVAIETGTIGMEGFSGVDVLLGVQHWTDTTVCQIEGECMCMSASDFRKAVKGESALRRIVQRFVAVYLSLVSQSVACNRLHNIEERFARWVLMTHDRLPGDEFSLTQEFLADMLGVHRPSVSVVAGAFQQAGYIRYSRGRMTILDRRGLEAASCECYGVCARQIEELLGPGKG
jgi:CRP-like cAMP-binding protein